MSAKYKFSRDPMVEVKWRLGGAKFTVTGYNTAGTPQSVSFILNWCSLGKLVDCIRSVWLRERAVRIREVEIIDKEFGVSCRPPTRPLPTPISEEEWWERERRDKILSGMDAEDGR